MQPLYAPRLDAHDIKSTGRHGTQLQQVMARRENNAPLLGDAHAGQGTAMGSGRAFANLDKDQCAIACAHDQVNLAAAATWGSIIALYKLKSTVLQVQQRGILRSVTRLFGGDCGFSLG